MALWFNRFPPPLSLPTDSDCDIIYAPMFLKSLVLRGFKTFADQTEIEFSENARITAIVGPNGCGKSNILDATRWVLGEDNPRELRVAALSDIIHAGTAARKSMSLAEVTMIFDNSSGRFPIPFTEVAIKRRTFREGESEFFINKNQCRLKDIKDLLLDTGLGESSYSIITQGQVDAILSSKGTERRAVFEEAAGINKYKTRKLSAEKKLISAEQNILRINDLKIEVGEHLIGLENQAKKAREYLEIQAQVRELDLGLSKRQLAAIREKQSRLTAELEEVRRTAAHQKEAEAKELQELLSLKDVYRQLEKEIDELLVKNESEKDLLRDLELDRRFVESEIGREEKTLATITEKEHRLKEKMAELEALLSSEQSAGTAYFPQLARTIVDQAAGLVAGLSTLLAGLGQKAPLSLAIGTPEEKSEVYQLKLEMLREESRQNQAEEGKTRFALQAHQSELASLTDRSASAKAEGSAAGLLAQKKTAKEELQNKIIFLEDKLRGAESAHQSGSQQASLEVALAKLEGELNGLQEKLSLEYNLTLAELEQTAFETATPGKAKSEVEAGKARLRQLEPVNLLAIEEFDKAKERLSFIETQLLDLSSAKENLNNLIKELDLKAEETFIQTMAEVSKVFSETFAQLFLGGEAKISLTPGVPPLDAEIEISVRPNGRKWLPLPLLSGGERSLSAIAILFSLLKIRPSPFCFMDEVDAALDDANIGRFAGMLKDFSEQSQIIVISHNKKSMAVADNIYGITMEEPGISKVISMKLAEAAT